MVSIAQAQWRWDGKLECSFPYSRFLVENLKVHIPVPGREWNPERKIWIIDPVWASTAIRLMRDVFSDVEVIDHREPYEDPFRAKAEPTIDPDYAVLYILPSAPRIVVDAVYRVLVKECHPDRVPEPERASAHEKMIALTNAYDAVRDRLVS